MNNEYNKETQEFLNNSIAEMVQERSESQEGVLENMQLLSMKIEELQNEYLSLGKKYNELTEDEEEITHDLYEDNQLKKVEDMFQQVQEQMKKFNQSNNEAEDRQKVIEVKSKLSVKEFTAKYPGWSSGKQSTARGRLYNKLPHYKTVEGGNITYIVKEVDEWFENEKIRKK